MTRRDFMTSSVATRLSAVRVAVVGDIMLDVWVEGPVRRISPEAPVAVVDVEGRSWRLGGAANVAGHVVELGAGTELIGIVGDDEPGARISALLESVVEESGLVWDPTRRSTCKTRIVSNGQQICRVDEEDRFSIAVDIEDQVLGQLDAAFDKVDVVIVSDYGKGTVTDRVFAGVVDAAQKRGLAVIVDPSGDNAGRFASASVVKPNRAEALAALGLASNDDQSATELAMLLRCQLGGCGVLVTDGPRGIGVATEAGTFKIAGIPRDVADVTGAGDAVVATVALAAGAGLELEVAAQLGNAAGAVAVSKWGTASFTLLELLAVLADDLG